ncbi:hypothetical protein V1511DRAFT_505120 [Dipodascopsis uninucleata]
MASKYRFKKVVEFVPSSDTVPETVQASQPKGDSISSFYSSLVGLHNKAMITDEWPSQESDSSNNNQGVSLAQQASLTHIDPPLVHLPVEKNNVGYRYLVRYGWNPLDREGIGRDGRKGRRSPLIAEQRTGKEGVGVAKQRQKYSPDIAAKEKKTNSKLGKSRRSCNDLDKRERERLMKELYR